MAPLTKPVAKEVPVQLGITQVGWIPLTPVAAIHFGIEIRGTGRVSLLCWGKARLLFHWEVAFATFDSLRTV